MAIIRTNAISESGIVFFSAGGHSHDGINSSIIDTSKYSIFDFGFGLVGSNQDRIQKQIINQTGFKNFIIKTVNESVLEPAGVVLQDNIINSRNIIAGSITSVEIAANTITADNIAANTITADKLQVGAITAGSVEIAANGVPNGDYWSSNGTFQLGGSTGMIYDGNTITLGSNTVITGSVDIGGPDNASLQIDTSGALWVGHRTFGSAPFRVYSNGRVVAGNGGVDISTGGTLNVSGSTTVGGTLVVNGTTISLGAFGSSTTVAGTLQVNSSTSIAGSLTVNGTTNINGPLNFNSAIGTIQMNANVQIAGSVYTTGSIGIGSNTVTIASNGDITRASVWSLTGTGFYAAANTVSVTAAGFGFPAGGIFDATGGGVGIRVGPSSFRFILTDTNTVTAVSSLGSGNQMHYNSTFGVLQKTSSMRELKDNISYDISGLDTIKQLKPASFTWKPQPGDSEDVAALRPLKIQYGFIAEDIADINRSLAVWDAGIDSWDLPDEEKRAKILDLENWRPSYYDHAGILCFLVASVQELAAKVEALEARL